MINNLYSKTTVVTMIKHHSKMQAICKFVSIEIVDMHAKQLWTLGMDWYLHPQCYGDAITYPCHRFNVQLISDHKRGPMHTSLIVKRIHTVGIYIAEGRRQEHEKWMSFICQRRLYDIIN